MSRIVFWAAFITAIFLSVALSSAPPHTVAQIAGSALAWIATFSLAWGRWVGKPGAWLGRLAACAGALVLAAVVYDWLPRTDVFVILRKHCPPRMGSFWPLLFVWLCGAGLQTLVVWGKRFRPASVLKLPTLRSLIWWLLVIPWTGACAYVFARNINADAFGVSLLAAGKLVGGLILVTGIIIAVGWLFSLPGRKGHKQAAADYEKIDEPTRAEILDMIDRHSRTGGFRWLYRPSSGVDAQASMARIGGKPLVRADETWPVDDDGSPGTFLLQLPLSAASWGSWKGRLIAVYLMQHELRVKSYGNALLDELIPGSSPSAGPMVMPAGLQALAIPTTPNVEEDAEEEDDGLDIERLMEDVPGLKFKLAALTAHPVRVLSKVLAGQADARYFDMEKAILAGGAPMLIQGAHDPVCTRCQQPMRFLFQFGDVTESFELGDGGVGYIYGCDAHPGLCQGFVDCF